MALSLDMTRQVQHTLNRWNKESAMHFCRLARRDTVRFQNIVYPTGFKTVRASCPTLGEAAEVPLRQAKELRLQAFVFRA